VILFRGIYPLLLLSLLWTTSLVHNVHKGTTYSTHTSDSSVLIPSNKHLNNSWLSCCVPPPNLLFLLIQAACSCIYDQLSKTPTNLKFQTSFMISFFIYRENQWSVEVQASATFSEYFWNHSNRQQDKKKMNCKLTACRKYYRC